MTDTIARTIAALREFPVAVAAELYRLAPGRKPPNGDDILVLCDAAEAGLRCPPREPTQAMLDAGSLVFHREQQKMIPKWEPSIAARFWRAMWDAAPKINGGQGHEAAARCPTEGIAPSEATRLTADASGRMTDAIQRGQLGADAGSTPAPPTINEGGQDAATLMGRGADAGEVTSADPVPPSPAAPASDADGLVARLRACYDEHEESCRVAQLAEGVRYPICDMAEACRKAADTIARLTRERDGARDESAARQHEVNAYRAECERLRALLERWRAEYGGSTFPKTGKPCNKRLDDDTDAAIDAGRKG